MKKKVIHIVNDKNKFEEEVNKIPGKFMNPSFQIDDKGHAHYFAVIYYE